MRAPLKTAVVSWAPSLNTIIIIIIIINIIVIIIMAFLSTVCVFTSVNQGDCFLLIML